MTANIVIDATDTALDQTPESFETPPATLFSACTGGRITATMTGLTRVLSGVTLCKL